MLAAEAVYGRGGGKDKLVYALNRLKERGYRIETNEVLDAIEAEWKKLDIEEIAAGIKNSGIIKGVALTYGYPNFIV